MGELHGHDGCVYPYMELLREQLWSNGIEATINLTGIEKNEFTSPLIALDLSMTPLGPFIL